MVKADWTIYEEDYWAINSVLKELLKNSNSQSILLIDKTGQMIASVGVEPGFDLMSFASLCAADFEANSQLAQLIGEKDFSTLYHQGSDESMYLAKVASHIILVVLFNKRTTLGLVRLRVKKAIEGLNTVLSGLFEKLQYENEDLKEFDEEFTDELNKEIDSLFTD
ncbi:MAG: roadblock/LC7 domain-containing protein [Candidatus Latescibacteria bacterium]|nr:roadblock/LC7 domain-containing protein [Candidatus Latescibacterota bacterium]NIM21142.1 roadblock/LC7 domain-containing protein [Candidatus Latescibacterota bacterium]NIM65277.1 roadblock/LC7 domain-containing protein [Candidatus Latescibacterota bacterium]NIO01792.1 roadblock/LC7 domain-containing protein [Candidatus Latescibacterota bacterium]NIO28309.1 roadblock/LC7 domain-containing protein [Candidatus Latescibacterota bacterium]